MRTTALRRAVLAGAATALAVAVPITASAQDDVFRFWGYYQWTDDAWAFAQTGPAEATPADGAVEGWRYAVAGAEPRFPRADGDFELICGSAEAAAGEKRVAVVIDYGTAADAEDGSEPPAAEGACAVVPEDATGADVLAEVTEVRLDDSGLACGLGGHPAQGCGGAVNTAAPTGPEESVELALPEAETPAASGTGDDAEEDDDGFPVGLLVGIGAVAVIGVAAAVRARGSSAT
ncbi:MAG: SCO2322 family protein [Jiangellaceae bacterium]